jgi:uncharacterized protein YegP (UPF0339 family)
MSRFEIVRTDAEQPWHARTKAGNGKIGWRTENYARRSTALDAIASVARDLSPTDQVWVSTGTDTGDGRSEVRYGSFGHETYVTAHRIAIRDVDERRTDPPDPTDPTDLRVRSFDRVSYIDFGDEADA